MDELTIFYWEEGSQPIEERVEMMLYERWEEIG